MAAATFNTVPELEPHYSQTITQSNFIDFADGSFNQWAQQYMPDLYNEEVDRYGNRMVSGLLSMTGAEIPLESDQVIWTEKGRLHLHYDNITVGADTAGANTLSLTGSETHSVRAGQTILITDGTTELRAYVTAGQDADDTELTVKCYTNATGLVDAGLPTDTDACEFFVYGSEFGKGTAGMATSITPEVNTFNNKPIILKDHYAVSGSDTAQIGWIEASSESDERSSYYWYLKAKGDTVTRFNDYLEMSMLESVEATHTGVGVDGTQGMFDAVESRGIIAQNMFDDASEFISDFQLLDRQLDKQGTVEENILYLGRTASQGVDNGLATANSYGSGGTSYGVFNNSQEMALNLGFSDFRSGAYDYYKTDWKYLNDPTTRGAITGIQGALIPGGSKSVYDQVVGKNITRPYLHVRYRASGATNRKMMTRVLGFEAGTSDIDETSLEMLSERCLVTQAANNFALFK